MPETLVDAGRPAAAATAPLLQADALECVRGERSLFDGLALDLSAGECLHVAGANGAGKTSLLRILAGLLAPTHGTVRWRGRQIDRARDEYAAELAFVGHHNGIKDDLTVLENVRGAAALRGADASPNAARAALQRLGLDDFSGSLVRHLSQGQKRRVALTRLCADPAPPLWILDEPFNALDAASVRVLREVLDAHLRAGGLMVLTAHQQVELPAPARRLELTGAPGE